MLQTPIYQKNVVAFFIDEAHLVKKFFFFCAQATLNVKIRPLYYMRFENFKGAQAPGAPLVPTPMICINYIAIKV